MSKTHLPILKMNAYPSERDFTGKNFEYSLSIETKRSVDRNEILKWFWKFPLLIWASNTKSKKETSICYKLMPYDARMIDETIRWKINTKTFKEMWRTVTLSTTLKITIGLRCSYLIAYEIHSKLKWRWSNPPTNESSLGKRVRSIKPIEVKMLETSLNDS